MRNIAAALGRIAPACGLLLLSAAGFAAELPQPTGRVILTVTGKIGATNGKGVARFDRAMLRKVGWTSIDTYTAYTKGKRRFSGVPLTALLKYVGARGETIRAVALNDFKATLPAADAAEYGVLLALRLDGKTMPVRAKGPIWIIYPADQPQTEKTGKHNDKMVWQLKTLEIE